MSTPFNPFVAQSELSPVIHKASLDCNSLHVFSPPSSHRLSTPTKPVMSLSPQKRRRPSPISTSSSPSVHSPERSNKVKRAWNADVTSGGDHSACVQEASPLFSPCSSSLSLSLSHSHSQWSRVCSPDKLDESSSSSLDCPVSSTCLVTPRARGGAASKANANGAFHHLTPPPSTLSNQINNNHNTQQEPSTSFTPTDSISLPPLSNPVSTPSHEVNPISSLTTPSPAHLAPPSPSIVSSSHITSPSIVSPTTVRPLLSPRCSAHSFILGVSTPPESITGSSSPSPVLTPRTMPHNSPQNSPTWNKPAFLANLHVDVNENNAVITSPVPVPVAAPVLTDEPKSKFGRFLQPLILPPTPPASSDVSLLSCLSGASSASLQMALPFPTPSYPLTTPVDISDGVAAAGAHYSISMRKGRRRNQEDMYIDGYSGRLLPSSLTQPLNEPLHLWGVADGHGKAGSTVAQLTSQMIQVKLREELTNKGINSLNNQHANKQAANEHSSLSSLMTTCFESSFDSIDKHILSSDLSGGCTCCTAYVHCSPPTLFVSNIGDSRCVLSSGGVAVPLTQDHKPNLESERERIEAAGGQVIFYSGWRVDGILNISRAIGDAHLKSSQPEQSRVISKPSVTSRPINETDEFVILASDGVWSCVDNQKAVDIVRDVLLGNSHLTPLPSPLQSIRSQRPQPSYCSSHLAPPPPPPHLPMNPPPSSHPVLGHLVSTDITHSAAGSSYQSSSMDVPDLQRYHSTDISPFSPPRTNRHLDMPRVPPPLSSTFSSSSTVPMSSPPPHSQLHASLVATPSSASASAPPCCWSSLSTRPELIARASEALIEYALNECGSMDNISVCIVLLFPYQQDMCKPSAPVEAAKGAATSCTITSTAALHMHSANECQPMHHTHSLNLTPSANQHCPV